jgi:hypothetical protein
LMSLMVALRIMGGFLYHEFAEIKTSNFWRSKIFAALR